MHQSRGGIEMEEAKNETLVEEVETTEEETVAVMEEIEPEEIEEYEEV